MNELLVVASSVVGGRTACADHARGSAHLPSSPTASARISHQCAQCIHAPHRAFFVVDELPLCIRHSAEAAFPDDDMGAHNMAHALYLRLHRDGVRGAY